MPPSITPKQHQEFVGALDEFTKFLNKQTGMYTDACAGFAENKRVIEIQQARCLKPSHVGTDENGMPIVMFTSLEDPNSPDSIQLRIIRSGDYIADNSEGGSHEQQHSRAVIIFIFTFWEDEIRPRLAKAFNVDVSEIKSNIMGDLRIIRHAILHAKAKIKNSEHKRLKVLQEFFDQDKEIVLSHSKMDTIFKKIHQDLARLLIDFTGTDAPIIPGTIKQIAVQRRK